MSNKPYQPDRFTQNLTPIETLQEENQQLKHLVNRFSTVKIEFYIHFV